MIYKHKIILFREIFYSTNILAFVLGGGVQNKMYIGGGKDELSAFFQITSVLYSVKNIVRQTRRC